MAKKNQTVEMSAATVNALKNMLFGNVKEGVNLGNIINDLCVGGSNRDAVAINVALAYMGAHVDIDKNPRFTSCWRKSYTMYTFKSFSLLLNMVTCEERTVERNDEDGSWKIGEKSHDTMFTLEQWDEMEDSPERLQAEINERYPIKNDEVSSVPSV